MGKPDDLQQEYNNAKNQQPRKQVVLHQERITNSHDQLKPDRQKKVTSLEKKKVKHWEYPEGLYEK